MQTEVTDIENIDENSVNGWQSVTVDKAFEFTGKPRSLDIPEGEPIPFIPMDGISESSRKINYAESRTLEEIKSGSFVFKDDLLIAKITPSFENGKQAILDDLSNDYGYATTEVWVLHPKEEVKVLKEYLFYYLRRSKVRSDLAGKMEGSTGRQRLPKGVLKNLELYSPPLNEQQKIISILNTVQDAIEQTEAVIQATRELKKSMMKHLFSYGPVPVDQTDQVELEEIRLALKPQEWVIKQLADISSINYGKSNTKEEGKYQVIGSGGQYSTSNKSLTNGESIVIGRKGSAGSVYYFKDAIYPSDTTFYLVFKDNADVNIKFVYYYMLTNKLSGEHAKTTLPSIQKHDLETFKIPLPKISIQNSIAHNIDTIDKKIHQEIDKKKSLESLFNSLLENLMTAKIRVV